MAQRDLGMARGTVLLSAADCGLCWVVRVRGGAGARRRRLLAGLAEGRSYEERGEFRTLRHSGASTRLRDALHPLPSPLGAAWRVCLPVSLHLSHDRNPRRVALPRTLAESAGEDDSTRSAGPLRPGRRLADLRRFAFPPSACAELALLHHGDGGRAAVWRGLRCARSHVLLGADPHLGGHDLALLVLRK